MHLAPLIQDLAVILGVAAAATYIFRAIKQPVVLGYIAAGIIVGPYTPPIFSIVDTESVKIWSELGVIFLMFALGLEFSFRKLLTLGPSAGFTGIFQIFFMVIAGYFLAAAFGWSKLDSIFLGCMIAVSSTTIIIKALEELNLKSRKFAELTFGILIVEDLAAILMLVALTNFVTQSLVDPSALLMAGGKLLFVVSLWIIFGMFIIPGVIKRVAGKGNDEMLTIAALGLCLGLVTLASKLEYSVALGAFIMGSILSETTQVKRIEQLMTPLRDVFGAIFFVSVGMLLDPAIIVGNFSHVVLLSLVIIVGKIFSVTAGSLIIGNTVETSIMTGFSMAQVGEFSFIIAALGQSLGVINAELYPIIVAASLVTTFTTPYLVKVSLPLSEKVESMLPPKTKIFLDRYHAWFQRSSTSSQEKRNNMLRIVRFMANAAVVVALFIASSQYMIGWLSQKMQSPDAARVASWILTMIVASPFIWTMLNSFKVKLVSPGEDKAKRPPFNFKTLIGAVLTLLLIALLSAEFFSGWISLAIFIVAFLTVVFLFRTRVGSLSLILEKQFLQGFSGQGHEDDKHRLTVAAQKLVPWEAHLVPVEIPVTSPMLGHTLIELKLREKYGINVVAINREHLQIVAPGPNERIYPHDTLLCFASDKEVEVFRNDCAAKPSSAAADDALRNEFTLRQMTIPKGAPFVGRSIKESGIFTNYNCLVVGLERANLRIKSPRSDQMIEAGDTLWLIGTLHSVQKLIDDFHKSAKA